VIIELLTYLLRFIGILFLQILIVNNIELNTYINPFIYVIFILALPVNIKPWVVLVISFITGIIMDSFSSTPGLHMAATVFMGYLRGFYLQIAASKEDLEGNITPSISQKGPIWFLIYAFVLVLAHHVFLFFLEMYSFREFFRTLIRIIFSTTFSVAIIMLGELLFYKSVKQR